MAIRTTPNWRKRQFPVSNAPGSTKALAAIAGMLLLLVFVIGANGQTTSALVDLRIYPDRWHSFEEMSAAHKAKTFSHYHASSQHPTNCKYEIFFTEEEKFVLEDVRYDSKDGFRGKAWVVWAEGHPYHKVNDKILDADCDNAVSAFFSTKTPPEKIQRILAFYRGERGPQGERGPAGKDGRVVYVPATAKKGEEEDSDGGISTLGWIGIGTGAVALISGTIYLLSRGPKSITFGDGTAE